MGTFIITSFDLITAHVNCPTTFRQWLSRIESKIVSRVQRRQYDTILNISNYLVFISMNNRLHKWNTRAIHVYEFSILSPFKSHNKCSSCQNADKDTERPQESAVWMAKIGRIRPVYQLLSYNKIRGGQTPFVHSTVFTHFVENEEI